MLLIHRRGAGNIFGPLSEPVGISEQTMPPAARQSRGEQSDRGPRSTVTERRQRGCRKLPQTSRAVQGK